MPDDLEMWAGDFEAIRRSLVYLGVKRVLHRSHVSRISGRKMRDGTAIVHRWMQENYADSMLMGLRRMLDDRRDTFSLIRLLRKLEKRGDLFSFEMFADAYEKMHGTASTAFVEGLYWMFSTDGRMLDKSRVREDIKRTLASYNKIQQYIKNEVAHKNKSRPDETSTQASIAVTWDELDELFEEVVALFNKYYKLVKPGVHVDFEPVLPAGYQQAFDRMLQKDNDQQTYQANG